MEFVDVVLIWIALPTPREHNSGPEERLAARERSCLVYSPTKLGSGRCFMFRWELIRSQWIEGINYAEI